MISIKIHVSIPQCLLEKEAKWYSLARLLLAIWRVRPIAHQRLVLHHRYWHVGEVVVATRTQTTV